MPRITRKVLQTRVHLINTLLERPTEQFLTKVGEQPVRFNLGHLTLGNDGFGGWALEEQTSHHGSVHVKVSGLSIREMDIFLDGLLRGIGLRNDHLGELVWGAKMIENELTSADAPLYNKD